MCSSLAVRRRLVLGQIEVADMSNELGDIPKLLDLPAIEGAIVSIDAIGCHATWGLHNARRLRPRKPRLNLTLVRQVESLFFVL
jgi:predicted transposase YbfD/YdcC